MRRAPLVVVIVVLVLSWAGFALVQKGQAIRGAHLDAELRNVVPTLTRLVASYTEAHRERGAWPDPGTVYDESMLPFLGSRDDGGDRVDTYGTLIDGRRIEVTLGADGSIEAWVVSE
ncbi:MAG: hypothetical protein AAF750_13525 [Planctomycetota bacterium]